MSWPPHTYLHGCSVKGITLHQPTAKPWTWRIHSPPLTWSTSHPHQRVVYFMFYLADVFKWVAPKLWCWWNTFWQFEDSAVKASARALLLRLMDHLRRCLRPWTDAEREWDPWFSFYSWDLYKWIWLEDARNATICYPWFSNWWRILLHFRSF